jgi:hypothetical protein
MTRYCVHISLPSSCPFVLIHPSIQYQRPRIASQPFLLALWRSNAMDASQSFRGSLRKVQATTSPAMCLGKLGAIKFTVQHGQNRAKSAEEGAPPWS